MYQILKKRRLSSNVVLLVIDAPYVAKKAEPGQFIILRVDAEGERIPLTISEYDREKGTISIVVQEVGATTIKLGQMEEGDCLHDFVGPLGIASELEGYKRAAVEIPATGNTGSGSGGSGSSGSSSGGSTTPAKKPVQSVDTGDMGIALYAGMTILSLTGGAWVANKKRKGK